LIYKKNFLMTASQDQSYAGNVEISE